MPPTQMKHFPIVNALRIELDRALRTVARYDADSHDIMYMRDDVAMGNPPENLEKIFENLRLENWGKDAVENRFTAGSLRSQIYEFDDALMVHVTTGEFEGVLVAFDRALAEISMRFCRSAVPKSSSTEATVREQVSAIIRIFDPANWCLDGVDPIRFRHTLRRIRRTRRTGVGLSTGHRRRCRRSLNDPCV